MKRTFRVYFKDSNQMLFESGNMVEVLNYLVYKRNFLAVDIVRIEEVL